MKTIYLNGDGLLKANPPPPRPTKWRTDYVIYSVLAGLFIVWIGGMGL